MTRANQKNRSDKLRHDIIDTALEMALEGGFESLSIRKISNRMGYSTGILYYHFKDKQEIIEAIQQKQGAEMYTRIQNAIDPAKNTVENLRSIYHCIMLLALEESKKYNLVVTNRHQKGRSEDNRLAEVLRSHLEDGVRKGELQISDISCTAYALWSSFIGFNLFISQQNNLSREQAEALFDAQFNMILHGISS